MSRNGQMKERMHQELLYLPNDEEIMKEQEWCQELLYDFNQTRPSQKAERTALLKKMFAELGDNCYIEPPLHPNCRCHIEPMKAVEAGYATKDGQYGADYWIKYVASLPKYYITKDELIALGWEWGKSPAKFAPGKMLTRGIYQNRNAHLPQKPGRVWYEADINYYSGRRNGHRLLWSNDGLLFVTYDHYETFLEII